jgi:hypothetical protein
MSNTEQDRQDFLWALINCYGDALGKIRDGVDNPKLTAGLAIEAETRPGFVAKWRNKAGMFA